MKQHRYLILCFILAFQVKAQAQKTDNSLTSKGFTGLRIGMYVDNGVHPGLKFGTSYLYKEKIKVRKHRLKFLQKKRGDKTKIIHYMLDANAGFYNHPNNHLGTFVGIGYTRLRTKPRKMKTLGWSYEVNYLRRFYNIKTYELDESGNVNTVKGAGRNSLMFAIAPSFGKVLGTKKGGEGWHLYIKPALQVLKYNHSFFPNAALEIGGTFKLTGKAQSNS